MSASGRLHAEQSFHILKKDARYLRVEIGLVLVLVSIFGLTHTRFPDYPAWALLGIAGVYLVARLIHAESLTDDDQFWMTRPYRWTSLLGAKLAFMLLFVNLPVFLIQLFLFADEGFPLFGNLGGILWSQFLLVFAVSLPAAALASLTRGIAGFMLSTIAIVAVAVAVRENLLGGPAAGWPDALGWTRDTLAGAALIPLGLTILGLQYSRRTTGTCRAIGTAGVALVLLATSFMPVPVAMALQSWTSASGPSIDDSAVTVRIDAALKGRARRTPEGMVGIEVPLVVSTAGESLYLDVHTLHARIESSDGTILVDLGDPNGLGGPSTRATPKLYTTLSSRDFDAWRGRPLELRLSIGMTLLGNASRHVFDLSGQGFEVEGIYCTVGRNDDARFEYLECRSPFRWPALWMHTDFSGGEMGPIRAPESYSPFPGGIDLNRVSTGIRTRAPQAGDAVRVVLWRPVAHLTKTFETTVDLSDFVRE